MPSAVLITYNKLPGIATGRQIIGDFIVFSGDYGRDNFLYKTTDDMKNAFLKNPQKFNEDLIKQKAEAKKEFDSLIKSINFKDLDGVHTIILYIGVYAAEEMFTLAKMLKGLNKKILIIACDCNKEQKQLTADKINIEILFTEECGGRKTCKSFIDGWNSVEPLK